MGFEPKINSKIAYVHRKESFLNNFIFFLTEKRNVPFLTTNWFEAGAVIRNRTCTDYNKFFFLTLFTKKKKKCYI